MGPIYPAPGINRGKVPVPDGCCSCTTPPVNRGKYRYLDGPLLGYGKPTQSIDANINDDPVRYIVELPEKSATTEEWLESIGREDAGPTH